MRRAALVGTMVTFAAMVFLVLTVTSARATSANLPALQATATATADADTTATVGAGTTATVGAGTTATVGAGTTATAGATATTGAATGTTATATSQGQLPNTGASGGSNLTLLVIGAALLLFGGFAVMSLLTNRRKA
ncbi:MAG TPA: hypothetical protein VEZ12_03275 [Herpetosiphonaceae bacterium]|nr:hypothetical protein [Herpetosiphonaceae bacterium]